MKQFRIILLVIIFITAINECHLFAQKMHLGFVTEFVNTNYIHTRYDNIGKRNKPIRDKIYSIEFGLSKLVLNRINLNLYSNFGFLRSTNQFNTVRQDVYFAFGEVHGIDDYSVYEGTHNRKEYYSRIGFRMEYEIIKKFNIFLGIANELTYIINSDFSTKYSTYYRYKLINESEKSIYGIQNNLENKHQYENRIIYNPFTISISIKPEKISQFEFTLFFHSTYKSPEKNTDITPYRDVINEAYTIGVKILYNVGKKVPSKHTRK